jgi:DNA-directed RNA polymerase sigma subunit (sigma70/sigma32)
MILVRTDHPCLRVGRHTCHDFSSYSHFIVLRHEGMQGLIIGAKKLDVSKGFKFSMYSHWWIKQAIHKSILEQTQIIHIPVCPLPPCNFTILISGYVE